MNKDVIYIEPEDDITDIITKIEKSKEKIIALVPPKKAGVFRSVVNIKLIAKTGTNAEKTIVLVTTDPSIVRLAATTKLPVTKDLQSAPSVPALDEDSSKEITKEELIEESDGTVETKEDVEELEGGDKPEEVADEEKDEKEEEEEDDKDEKEEDEDDEDDIPFKKKSKSKEKPSKKQPAKGGNKFVNWIRDHKKLSIAGGVGGALLIVFLIWAFAIAPTVTVTVTVSTTPENFSENVSFTTTANSENIEDGVFYLEEKKLENSQEVAFEATGKKNTGEKATGELVIYTFFREPGAGIIDAGSSFTFSGLTYLSTEAITLSWDGESFDNCDNKNNAAQLLNSGCQVSDRIKVIAAEAGSDYNKVASNSGWSTTASVGVYSDKAMSGGTDEVVTVVLQSDIDKAKEQLAVANEAERKEELFASLGDDVIPIESSFTVTTTDGAATPAVGEEVKEGVTPTLKATTTATVYVIDKAEAEKFVRSKAEVKDGQTIYEIKAPYVDKLSHNDSGYTGKLKTSYSVGPEITENSIAEIVKGKGLGEAQRDLRDIDGVASVTMDPSYPWVFSVPNNPNKITVVLQVKDQSESDKPTKNGE